MMNNIDSIKNEDIKNQIKEENSLLLKRRIKFKNYMLKNDMNYESNRLWTIIDNIPYSEIINHNKKYIIDKYYQFLCEQYNEHSVCLFHDNKTKPIVLFSDNHEEKIIEKKYYSGVECNQCMCNFFKKHKNYFYLNKVCDYFWGFIEKYLTIILSKNQK